METNGDGWTDAESLQFLLLQFILYTWLKITLLNTNLTMSLLCLINHYCFPKDLRIMFYLEDPLWPGPPYFSGLISYHFSIALFTLVNSQESCAISLLHADYQLSSDQHSSPCCGHQTDLAYPSRLNINIASIGKPLLTTLPGWAYFLSLILIFLIGVNRGGRTWTLK